MFQCILVTISAFEVEGLVCICSSQFLCGLVGFEEMGFLL